MIDNKRGYKNRFDKYFPLTSFSQEQRFIIDLFVKMEIRRCFYKFTGFKKK